MCAPIMELSNALIYGNRLCCGSTEVANAKLEYTSSTTSSSWLKTVILIIQYISLSVEVFCNLFNMFFTVNEENKISWSIHLKIMPCDVTLKFIIDIQVLDPLRQVIFINTGLYSCYSIILQLLSPTRLVTNISYSQIFCLV